MDPICFGPFGLHITILSDASLHCCGFALAVLYIPSQTKCSCETSGVWTSLQEGRCKMLISDFLTFNFDTVNFVDISHKIPDLAFVVRSVSFCISFKDYVKSSNSDWIWDLSSPEGIIFTVKREQCVLFSFTVLSCSMCGMHANHYRSVTLPVVAVIKGSVENIRELVPRKGQFEKQIKTYSLKNKDIKKQTYQELSGSRVQWLTRSSVDFSWNLNTSRGTSGA